MNVELAYKKIVFKLALEKSLKIVGLPEFVLRGVLGFQLRKIACINKGAKCSECSFNKTCAYSIFFESILDKQNIAVPGRDRVSHPYTLNAVFEKDESLDFIKLEVVFFGEFVKYLPLIYQALVNAGEAGIFKERVKFNIEDVRVGDSSILISEKKLNTSFGFDFWKRDNLDIKNIKEGSILVQCQSPLRFKSRGRYTKDFDAFAFFMCLHRRFFTLCSLYGNFGEDNKYRFDNEAKIAKRNLEWKDYSHYSGRQKQSFKLGGVDGDFVLEGKFSSFDLALLDFGVRFQTGKNTNFGLGKINAWEKLD